MTEARILDLNRVLAPDIFVEVGKDENGEPRRYAFPGDAPMEDLLRLMIEAENLTKVDPTQTTPEEMLEMREQLDADVEDLFRLRNPELEEGEIRLTDRQTGELIYGLMRLYNEIMAGEAEPDEEGGARPTSTRQRPKSARRSRTSSARSRKPKAASGSSTSSPT